MRLESPIVRFITEAALLATTAALAPAAQVSGHVTVVSSKGATRSDHDTSVVVWITPAAGGEAARAETKLKHPQLLQKNKRFEPHVLAVQVGSAVEFPNHDPFFHNVFSLFEGKRFDLGLYEAGTSRMVRFDRPGISYIFCNIHPEMSAVVITMATPLYAVSSRDGQLSLAGVPYGRFMLHVWSEGMGPEDGQPFTREITIAENASSLGVIRVPEANGQRVAHKNKYGREYDEPTPDNSVYNQQR